jgi:hypothetical protein
MQHEMTVPGPLLDGKGVLAEAGWARRPVKAYDRAAIRAGGMRIKEWDYYCAIGGRFGVALTIADNGYMGMASASILDLEAAAEITVSAIVPATFGSLGAPASSDVGNFSFSRNGVSLRFIREPGCRIVEVDWPAFRSPAKDGRAKPSGTTVRESPLDGQTGLSGRVVFDQPEMDTMMIATPFPGRKKAFYYNQKINCMPATGRINFGSLAISFDPATAAGVLDWGRGVWTYANTWYWASASSRLEGVPFGFNLGYGFGDTSAASENVVFYRGKAHKLDAVKFDIPEFSFLGPWKIADNEGRLSMTFSPILDRASDSNILIIRSDQHQVFGRYSGKAVLDSGETLEFAGVPGFAEKVRNRW